MRVLAFLERHFAWIRLDGWWKPTPETVIERLHAHDSRLNARASAVQTETSKTHRTVLLNLATSVGGAVIIGVLSGIFTAERVVQHMSDTLVDHGNRLAIVESKYVPVDVHSAHEEKVKSEFSAINQRETETRNQLIQLQGEFNQFLLQQRSAAR